MTKKHFEAIARMFAERVAPEPQDGVKADRSDDAYQACREGLAKDLASYFKQVNPNFDRDRFLAACKVE
jgi:hypothetical protein